MKKPKHGGKRPNAGRPSKYGEPLRATTVRCPESRVPELKAIIKATLKTFEK
jgi:hypothetical protein